MAIHKSTCPKCKAVWTGNWLPTSRERACTYCGHEFVVATSGTLKTVDDAAEPADDNEPDRKTLS